MNIKDYVSSDNQFYPTPTRIIEKMTAMIDFASVSSILEPSAGKGDLIKGICSIYKTKYHCKASIVDCVELDTNLRAILKESGYNVVGDDFLSFNTYTQYNLIVMNPPFKDGDKHLLKALSMLKNGGQVCCLLNADTLKNPYSAYRKDLLRKLDEYEAKIEYVSDGFIKAERQTNVEIAIIYVNIPRVVYTFDVFDKLLATDDYTEIHESYQKNEMILANDVINSVLKQYNDECRLGLDLINQYNRLHDLIPYSYSDYNAKPLIEITVNSTENTETSMQNLYIRELRYKYWNLLFQSKEMQPLFTEVVREKLYADIQRFRNYDFTLSNIKTLQIELNSNLSANIEAAILKEFGSLTYEHSMGCNKNIHYFTGWKTNNACIVNKKVIIPCYGLYDSRWGGHWSEYKIFDALDELEKIFNYLDGGKTEGADLWTVKGSIRSCKFYGQTIKFKYFDVEPKKKGTLHVYFKDLELLKKFNIFGANKKGWLPDYYGKRSYHDMTPEEKLVIESFHGGSDKNGKVKSGEKDYAKVCKDSQYYLQLSACNNLLLLEAL